MEEKPVSRSVQQMKSELDALIQESSWGWSWVAGPPQRTAHCYIVDERSLTVPGGLLDFLTSAPLWTDSTFEIPLLTLSSRFLLSPVFTQKPRDGGHRTLFACMGRTWPDAKALGKRGASDL